MRGAVVSMVRRQQMFLDGIRQSVLMARIAYARLQFACVSHTDMGGPGPGADEIGNDLLSQSWLIVDASNRLRVLLHAMPGLTRSPAWQAVTRVVAPAETLRNYIQHLDMDPEIGEPRPLWGTMRWLRPMHMEEGRLTVAVQWYVPGPLDVGPVEPAIRGSEMRKAAFRVPVDDVTLTAAGSSLNLTNLVEGIERFGRRLENTMTSTEWAGENKRTRIDVGMEEDVTPTSHSVDSPRTEG
jgi:hypothetical protein